jgi:hypothetical protein
MRALPHHYREVKAKEGTLIRFNITGEGGGTWQLVRDGQQWVLDENSVSTAACVVAIDGKIAWRIFTKGISRDEAAAEVNISGRRELGEPILSMLAVMA